MGIVTDSFDVVAEIVRRRVFADFRVAHLMRFDHRVATGEVVLSPAMAGRPRCSQHRCCKGSAIRQLQKSAGLVPELTLAVGDGENDICMFRAVGTAIAFRPKSADVSEAAQYVLMRTLTDLLTLPGVLQNRTASPRGQGRLRGCLVSQGVDRLVVAPLEI